jgi:hypothetical protein
LKKTADGHKTEHRLRIRAQMVRSRGSRAFHTRIARETGLHPDTPARFTPVQVAQAKALACQLPAETGVSLSRWSCPEPVTEPHARGITNAVSASTPARRASAAVTTSWPARSASCPSSACSRSR